MERKSRKLVSQVLDQCNDSSERAHQENFAEHSLKRENSCDGGHAAGCQHSLFSVGRSGLDEIGASFGLDRSDCFEAIVVNLSMFSSHS